MRNHLKMLAAAVALAEAAAYAYTPVRHDGTYTTNGVTYAQRGGLGSADYVVTNVDAFAVGKVQSVNGMVGDVVIDAEGVGAVARDADYLAVSNAAIGAVQKEVDPSVPSWAKGDAPPLPPDYAAVASNAAVAVKTETDPTVPAWAKAATKPTYGTNDIDGLSAALAEKRDMTDRTFVRQSQSWNFLPWKSLILGDYKLEQQPIYLAIFYRADSSAEWREVGYGHLSEDGKSYTPNTTSPDFVALMGVTITKDVHDTLALTSDIPSGQDITNAATWAAGNAYEDAVAAANAHTDASISETNEDFVAAVHAASPPVVLPQKWALANVTNANGVAVTAADVGAVKRYVTSIDGTVELLSSTNRMYGLSGEENESSPSMMFAYTSPSYNSYRYDNYYGTHYYEFDKSTSPNKISYASISLGSLWNGFGVYCDDGYGNISSVSLPYNASGYFAIESWASLSRTLNATATNDTCKAACADVLEKISESKPHLAIIDGELHIITITD